MAQSSLNKWAWIWAAVAIAALAAAGYLWSHPRTVTVTKTEFKPVPQIQRVADVQRVYLPGPKQVVVLNKADVAQKLDMPWLEAKAPAAQPAAAPATAAQQSKPAETPPSATAAELVVAGDPLQAAPADPAPVPGDPQDLQVTTTADIEESDNGYEAASILNTKTGVSTLIVKEKVAPWFELESGVVAGLRYGLNTSGEQTGTAYAGWEFLRIKDIHVIGYGEINTGAEGKVQVDLQYRRH